MHFLCIQVIIIRHEESSGEGPIREEELCELAGPPNLIKTYSVKRKKRKPRQKLSEKVTNINRLIMIRDYTMILCRGDMCAIPAESSRRVCFPAV